MVSSPMSGPQVGQHHLARRRGRSRRESVAKHGHRGAVLWFTGLSGSGKSTIAHRVEKHADRSPACFRMCSTETTSATDLNSDLGFSPEEREENIRRIGEVSRLFADSGAVVLSAFISPYRRDRDRVRGLLGQTASLSRCSSTHRSRSARRAIRRASTRRLAPARFQNFTGLDAPYEAPERLQRCISSTVDAVRGRSRLAVSSNI